MKRETKRSKSAKKEAKSKTKAVGKQKKSTRTKSNNKAHKDVMEAEILPSPFSVTIESDHLKVKLHKNYEVKQKSGMAKKINNLFTLFLQKEKRRNKNVHRVSNFSYFPTFEFELGGEKPGDEKCSICQF